MRRLVITMVGFATLAAVYVGWHGLSHGDSGAVRQTSSPFGAAEREAFSVLRGPTRPLPQTLQAQLRKASNPAVKSLWLDRARYIPAGTGMWAVNGRGVTCIVRTRGGAISCEDRSNLFRSGVALGVVDLNPPPDRKPGNSCCLDSSRTG